MWIQGLTLGADITAVEESWIAAALALAIAAGASAGFRRARGTTLRAPTAWAIASALAIAAVEVWLAWQDDAVDSLVASLWRYAAAVGTFCPLIAVLGAKRPQDRGWQWVVLSLWVILLVPAMQAVAARSGQRLELFGAWRLLLAALIAMGLLNYLPTRYAVAAVFVAMGQSLLLGQHLFAASDDGEWRMAGLVLLLAATSAINLIASRRVAASPLNERWFAFRDGWGAFWGLRVMQRVNQTAELSGWPVRLEWWDGFTPKDETLGAQELSPIQQTLDSLLRRFERLDAAKSPTMADAH